MGDKQTFVMYKSWRQLFKNLPAEQSKELICAVYDYQVTGQIETSDPAVIAMFTMIKEKMDEDAGKYQATCDARKEAGSRGGKASAAKRKQNKANALKVEANGNQTVPNHNQIQHESEFEYDNEYVSEDNISSIPNGIDSLPKRQRIPYQDIVSDYNRTCISLPKVGKLTNPRKTAIKGRCTEYDISDIHRVFESAERSDFLSGRSGKWTSCGFDWLMKPSNFIKVLEGQYENKGGENNGQGRLHYSKEELYEKFKDDYI